MGIISICDNVLWQMANTLKSISSNGRYADWDTPIRKVPISD